MRWQQVLEGWNVHAEGEIGVVITGGLPALAGRTMLERLRHLEEVDDRLRRFLTLAPRGRPDASVVLLPPATEPGADTGFLVLQPDRTHAMSGSNAICAVTCLLETGIVPMVEPETVVRLDTAAGLVAARAECRGGRCRRVRLAMPWSFALALDRELVVPGIGRVRLDLAFGGVFYALVEAPALGLRVVPEEARRLVELGMRIFACAAEHFRPEHPERPGLAGLAYLMWCDRDDAGRPVNATVMPPGRLDRSPCGTGTSARLAAAFARAQMQPGEALEVRSVIGTRFEARILEVGRVADHPAIRPEIAGRGFLFGRTTFALDPEDPLVPFALPDVYGPGARVPASSAPSGAQAASSQARTGGSRCGAKASHTRR